MYAEYQILFELDISKMEVLKNKWSRFYN